MFHAAAEVEASATPAEESIREGRRPVSAARLAANRANAQKSTGPRTEEGKRRSRQNAVKHGLAGAGICLRSEDAEAVAGRCLQLHEEMAPTTVRGMMLVEMMALAHTRMKRAVRQEVAALNYAQRCAPIRYDDARLTEAEEDLRLLGVETRTRYRHLLMCPEGVDLLIERLGDVRAEVRNPHIRWSYIHGQCLERFCGRDYCDRLKHSRGRALSLALEFEDTELTEEDKAEIAEKYAGKIKEWAKPKMEALIDEELAKLEAHRRTLDHAGIERTRAEAAERALFDAGRDASLARRYEAAALRMFFRALKEYRLVEAEGIEPDPGMPSVLDEPSPRAAEVLDHGDGVAIPDPADQAARPAPERRSFERPPLASNGITVEEASRIISQPHYSRPPVPFDQPAPPLGAPPAPARRR